MTLNVLTSQGKTNTLAILAAVLGFLFLFYVFAVDQGLLFSLAQGHIAFDQQVLHELVHDARHAAGMPCH